jgi:parallel beta-helix repeat protein
MKTRAEAGRCRGGGDGCARGARGAIEPLERRLLLATLTVNSAADSNAFDDQLTLREAILFAAGNLLRTISTGEKNQISGATLAPIGGGWQLVAGSGAGVDDQIQFAEITIINPNSQLPDIGKNDRIDGAKPSGAKVILSGQSAGQATGLVLRGFNGPSGNQIRNMEVRNFFYDGIYGEGIKGGLFAGLEIHDNGQEGILLTSLSPPNAGRTYNTRDTRVGGAGGDRNFIYHNGRHGVSIFAATGADRDLLNNQIENNWIGLDKSGALDRGNARNGINLSQAHGNIIKNNVVSGNDNDGIQISGAQAHSNLVINNIIGMDPSEDLAIGNTFSGVALIDAGAYAPESGQANQIGTPGNPNVIAGNGSAGVYISGANATGNVVQFNAIGMGPGLGNGGPGVAIYAGANKNTVGGADASYRNVIQYSGGPGVDIANGGSTGNTVRNNYIGTDDGSRSRPNAGGVRIFGGAASNTIAVNVISGNNAQGVGIYNPGSSANLVQANFIGTNDFGSARLANGDTGVVIQEGASGNTITGNLISGNSQNGVLLQHSNTTGNVISGNKIGTKDDGTSSLGNLNHGVRINGAVGTTIGGGNVIRFNAMDGVFVESGTGNTIRTNTISSNGGLGIDLGLDGITLNDSLDTDSGANNLQNFPTLTAAILAPPAATFIGGLHSTPNTTFKIDLFSNPAGEYQGDGNFVTFDVTTDANGNGSFGHSYAAAFASGINITATATDPAGNTSEFSLPLKTATTQSPYPATPFSIPGLIQAEDFDEGGETVAYHDTTFQNEGGQYRQTGEDLETTSDTGGGYNVGFVKAGEWLEYSVNVANLALYDLAVRVANTAAGGRFHVEFNGANVTGNVNVPSTGGSQTWTTIHVPVTLAAGQQIMRVAFDAEATNGFVGNFNWLQFTLRPLVTSLTVNPNPADINSTLVLTAEASDADGSVSKVEFYRESNGTAGLQIGSDTLVGTDPAASGGWLAIISSVGLAAGNYTYYAVATDNQGAAGPAFSATHVLQNPPPPSLISAAFLYDGAPHQLQFVFSQDVGGSLGTPDLTLQDVRSGAVYPIANQSITYNPATKTARFSFPGFTNGVLNDGNYRATLNAVGITNSGGVPLDGDGNGTPGGDFVYNFFHLTADANHDRSVNFNDLVILAQNYNGAQKTFREGDFNYDTGTDFNDLVLLAQRYNTSLPAPASPGILDAGAPAPVSSSPAPVWDAAVVATRRVTPVNLFSAKRVRPRHR